MLTVAFRSDQVTALAAVVDADAAVLAASLDEFSAGVAPFSCDVIGQGVMGPLVEMGDAQSVLVASLAAAGLTVEKSRGVTLGDGSGRVEFDEIMFWEGDQVRTFRLFAVCPTCGGERAEFRGNRGGGPTAGVPRAPDGKWCKGAGCASAPGAPQQGPTAGGVGAPDLHGDAQIGRATSAQTDVAISDLSDRLAAAPDVGDARSAVLENLDMHGPASTVAQHDALPGNEWTAERTAQHNEIIDKMMSGDARYDREVVFLGGPPGAGKGSALNHPDGFHRGRETRGSFVDSDGFLHIDPDGVKQEMLDRGMVRRVPGMTDGEHAALLHVESGHIADRMVIEARARGMNVVIDKTMASSPARDIGNFRNDGYSVRGVFVKVPVSESKASAFKRWQDGGRYVPGSYIEQSRLPNGSTKNFENFRSSRGLMDEWIVIDNTGISKREPRATIVESGSGLGEFAATGTVVFKSSDVPRDSWGRWARGGGVAHASAVGDADVIIDGGKVTVGSAAAVPLIEELGTRPGSSDLTKVTIDGHPNLFGAVADNQLARHDMPQIPSDRVDDFVGYLGERGITSRVTTKDPAELRATQNQLDGRKVGQMITAIHSGRMEPGDKPVMVSADGFILDGHHRWAAEATLSVGESPRRMRVVEVSVPMTQLLGQARLFGARESIDSKRHGMSLTQRIAMSGIPVSFAFAGGDVPRDANGKWTKSGGAVPPTDYNSMTPGQKAAYTKKQKAAAAEMEAVHAPVSSMPSSMAEFDAMHKTGGPLGSNGGGWYRDEDGQKYLVKPAQSRQHAESELASQMLYRQLGVPVDDTAIFDHEGRSFIAKKAIQEPDGSLGKIVGSDVTPDIQMQARNGFHADALASSWDAYGMGGDNVLTSGGTLYRIDVGGSGQYRAMGADKPSFAPGKTWVEPSTLRSSTQGRRLYGDMSDQEAAFQLSKLQGFDVAGFDRRLAAAGISDPVRTRMVATVDDRVNVQLPGILAQLGG